MTEIAMHSWAATEPNTQLVPYSHASELLSGQIVVDVKSCSLTRGDIGFIDNKWGDAAYPIVPGLEAIGTVRESNGNELKAGEIVGIGYQVGACFNCEQCRASKEQFCPNQKLIPLQAYGGLGDAMVVDSRFAFRMPENLQSPEATPLLCAGLTVFSAIKRARIEAGMRVGVIGVGSLGHLAVQFLSKMDCTVEAFTATASKVEAIGNLGISATLLESGATMPERTYDAVFITSAGEVNWGACVNALKPEGTLSITGLPKNPLGINAEALADLAARRILGGYIGSRQEMQDMLAYAAKYRITAKSRLYRMSNANEALDDMRARRVPFSAVIVDA
jgi:alcohol/geraniol dehydrogenase (NADP+)